MASSWNPAKKPKKLVEQLRHLKQEIIQLSNYYFVFQGIIFTAFYNSPLEGKCRFRWLPFTLSLLVGSFNVCALFILVLKYKNILDDIDQLMVPPEGQDPSLNTLMKWKSETLPPL
ncbi:UNVERIFIED_CONTAM: hypothetical protein Sradi_1713400 [Sesamum radiatum]|uniref:Uncharacterized protein n=1 Tax=Sesamum radiatum TaxID=300843 RepID=A0AAW2TTI9_SESRA